MLRSQEGTLTLPRAELRAPALRRRALSHSMKDFISIHHYNLTASRRRYSVYSALPHGIQGHSRRFKIHASPNACIGPGRAGLRLRLAICCRHPRSHRRSFLQAEEEPGKYECPRILGWILPAAEQMHFPASASSAVSGLILSSHLQHQRPWLRLLHVSHQALEFGSGTRHCGAACATV
jgi:hypothetical protein